mmetsp:Transcript_52640/g.123094  ORF Transcript_52640/g.123094 Transcript_52640/m.123094 type:complete len:281 (+) Transcript_52640:388-1230(+)
MGGPGLGVGALGLASTRGASASVVREASVSDETLLLEESPGVREEAAAAAVVGLVAGDKLLRGEDDVGLALGSNAKAVREGLGGAEGPARAALLLITDGVDALGPLLAGVERGGDGRIHFLRENGSLTVWLHEGTAEGLGLCPLEIGEAGVRARHPAILAAVRHLHIRLVHGGLVVIAKIGGELSAKELVAGAVVRRHGDVVLATGRVRGNLGVDVEGDGPSSHGARQVGLLHGITKIAIEFLGNDQVLGDARVRGGGEAGLEVAAERDGQGRATLGRPR